MIKKECRNSKIINDFDLLTFYDKEERLIVQNFFNEVSIDISIEIFNIYSAVCILIYKMLFSLPLYDSLFVITTGLANDSIQTLENFLNLLTNLESQKNKTFFLFIYNYSAL